jgi:HD-GYP domain-containing protein (c-di-GMP phosphodiesterase class II)
MGLPPETTPSDEAGRLWHASTGQVAVAQAREQGLRTMAVEERKLAVGSLAIGMYVCRLDRPWEGTPFPLQGVRIDGQADIDALRRWSTHVWIDVEKSAEAQRRPLLLRLGYGVGRGSDAPAPAPVRWETTTTLEEELPKARGAWDRARELATRFIEDLHAGRPLAADELDAVVEPVVASIIRNPDAYFWLDALRRRDPYVYSHAINSAALVTTFGRHLGFPREILVELASGGMLMDLGFADVPPDVLAKPGPLDDTEREMVRGHVARSLEQMERAGVRGLDVREMVAGHHERHNGSGYPNGEVGLGIPLTARMLGIADTFDALCNDRPWRGALSRHDALQALYRERDRLFQSELIEQFSQCLGVYPTGSLVELTNGTVAVVTMQNSARRLFPRVTVLTDADKRVDPAFRQVDLWGESEGGRRLSILRALPPGAHGLDLAELFL